MEYNCGSSGVILFNKNKPNVIIKRTRRNNILREYGIHCLCYSICSKNKSKYTLLHVPRPISLINQRSYEMEKIEDDEMLGKIDVALPKVIFLFCNHYLISFIKCQIMKKIILMSMLCSMR